MKTALLEVTGRGTPRHLVASLLFCLVAALAMSAEVEVVEWRASDGHSLGEHVTGVGVKGVDASPLVTRDGHSVIWRLVYSSPDSGLDERHYQQVLIPAGQLAAALSKADAEAGLPVLGSRLVVRYDNDVPVAATGLFCHDIGSLGLPTIIGADEAAHALRRLKPERATEGSMDRSGGHQVEREVDAHLVVAGTEEGQLWIAWQLEGGVKAAEANHSVLVDAATGVPVDLGFDEAKREVAEDSSSMASTLVAGGFCTPGSTQSSAQGIPQNTAIPFRQLWAADSHESLPEYGFDHQGVYLGSPSTYPQVRLYVMDSVPRGCSGNGRNWGNWRLLPIKDTDGSIYYGWTYDPFGKEKTGGDALWHTHVSTKALKQRFGLCGIDGSCGPVYVRLKATGSEHTYCKATSSQDVEYPSNSNGEGLVIYPIDPSNPSLCRREASASLDVVAHELGHNYIRGELGGLQSMPLGTEAEEEQLMEGFADVMAYHAESYGQQAGKGFEKFDWCFGEDHQTSSWPTGATCPKSWRRVDSTANADNSEQPALSYSFHRLHNPPGYSQYPQVKGNMLPVALRLLAEGGTNPICTSHPEYDGCNVTVTGIGMQKAAKILMRVLTNHSSGSDGLDGWGYPPVSEHSLPNQAMLAAVELYQICPFRPATDEQLAVRKAFQSIGFPPTRGITGCP